MAKFSEIIGGIAKDLVQVQVSSDLSSMDILSHYKGNEILKNLDIPRFTISDINLKLKFAISEEAVLEQTESSVDYVKTEWLSILSKEVTDDVIASGHNLFVGEKKMIREEFIKATSAPSKPDLDIRNALDKKANTTVRKSTNFLMSVHNKLPAATKRKLPTVTSLKEIVSGKVDAVYNSRMPILRKVASSKAALERDLEIVVEKAALENINEEQIHEISLNLTPDFIKFVQEENK